MDYKNFSKALLPAVLVTLMSGCVLSNNTKAPAAEPVTQSSQGESTKILSATLSKIETGMDDNAVRKLLGNPDYQKSYMTGKAWIPFYFGSDVSRTDWIYDGSGVVTFTRNRYSGNLAVVTVRGE